ncbi:type II secretion system F family protein [Patescibacteria group bacterium]
MKFNYLARSLKGETKTGVIEASSQDAALNVLQKQGLIVIKLRSDKKMSFALKRIEFLDRVGSKDVYVFFRQLAILVGANVPLVQSLRSLSNQVSGSYFKDSLLSIADDIDGGTSLSKALSKYPKIFSIFSINLIKSGEVAGRLSESLNYLADYLERRYYLMTRVRGAMFYPGFVLFTFIVIGVLIMTMVMPNLTVILTESGQELPWTTNLIIFVSDFILVWWWMLLIFLVGGIVGGYQFINTRIGRRVWDSLQLKLPIFGNILKKSYLSQFADSLSALVVGGVSVIMALDVSGQVVDNVIYKEIILKARNEVKIGKNLSSVLEKHKEFTPLFVQMIKTGEKTGKMGSILNKLAVFYNKEIDGIVENLSKLIEPILLIFLAMGVAILVLAVFMPIYNLVGGM